MNKRTEAHVLAVIKSLEAQKALPLQRYQKLLAAVEACEEELDMLDQRLVHARALLGEVPPSHALAGPHCELPIVKQEPAPSDAPAPIPEGVLGLSSTASSKMVLNPIMVPVSRHNIFQVSSPEPSAPAPEESWRETLAEAEQEKAQGEDKPLDIGLGALVSAPDAGTVDKEVDIAAIEADVRVLVKMYGDGQRSKSIQPVQDKFTRAYPELDLSVMIGAIQKGEPFRIIKREEVKR